MTDIKDEMLKLRDFYEELLYNLKKTRLVVSLRPKLIKDVSDYFKGDFDFIIDKSSFIEIMEIIYSLSKNNGVNFILNQRSVNKKLFKFFINDAYDLSFTIELWTAIEYTEFKSKKSFLSKSILELKESNNIKEIEVLALLYITHLYHKTKDLFSEENQFRFRYFIEKLNAETKNTELLAIFRKLKDNEISIDYANNKAIEMLSSLGINCNSTFNEKLKVLIKKIKIKGISLKRIVPIVGPDGVGKGSISHVSLQSVKSFISFRFKSLYRLNKIYRMRLMMLSGYNTEARNQLDEKIPYYIFFLSTISLQALRVLKRNKGILMDRYFTDYLVTPLRYLEGEKVPKKIFLYNFFLFLTPMPNKMIFMGCKDSSLVARKNELPIISVKELQDVYCEFIVKKCMPEILFISTENTVRTSAKAMTWFLTEHERNLMELKYLK